MRRACRRPSRCRGRWRLGFLLELANAWQEHLDLLGLRAGGEAREQLFGDLDRLTELAGTHQLLDADFQFLAFLDLGVLAKRAQLLADALRLGMFGEALQQALRVHHRAAPEAAIDVVANLLDHARDARFDMDVALAHYAALKGLRLDVSGEVVAQPLARCQRLVPGTDAHEVLDVLAPALNGLRLGVAPRVLELL